MGRGKKRNLSQILAMQAVKDVLRVPGPLNINLKEDVAYKIIMALEQKVVNGKSFENFQREINIYLYSKGVLVNKEKLQLFYNSYFALFYESLHYKSNIQSIEYFPYWQYHNYVGLCKNAECKILNNKIFKANDIFWSTFYPPNHPGCMASVRCMTEEEFIRNNFILNDTTGIIHPDKDWTFNPGTVNWNNFFFDFIKKQIKLIHR